jgi:hypothetical protein
MLRRVVLTLTFAAWGLSPWCVPDARAQEPTAGAVDVALPAILLDAPLGTLAVGQLPTLRIPPVDVRATRPVRSAVLPSLYVSTAVMQALDVHSTLRALDRGAAEGNPLMSGLTKNRGAFIATKAAVAAGTIFATRQIGKRNKVAAVATLIAINSAYALVVRHNYQVK